MRYLVAEALRRVGRTLDSAGTWLQDVAWQVDPLYDDGVWITKFDSELGWEVDEFVSPAPEWTMQPCPPDAIKMHQLADGWFGPKDSPIPHSSHCWCVSELIERSYADVLNGIEEAVGG